MRGILGTYLFWTLLITALGCQQAGQHVLEVHSLYSTQTTDLIFEVDYMEGVAPAMERTSTGESVWQFLRHNVAALLSRQGVAVHVPLKLSDMEEIPAQGRNYTTDDVLDLAGDYRNRPGYEAGVASIYVLYLDGLFVEDGEPDASILGISFGTTGVIAMFKPAIQQRDTSSVPSVRAPAILLQGIRLGTFIEQTVLIHESGHALGLVNNGIEPVSDHHDQEHGAHCNNKNCVMFYLNEGSKDLREFLERENPSVETIIFGDGCLEDARSLVFP